MILQLGKEGNFLSPSPEYLGSTPDLPRSNNEYQSSEIGIGYQNSNPNFLNFDFDNSQTLNQEITNQERALAVVNPKQVFSKFDFLSETFDC